MSVPYEALYLELGVMPLKMIIKGRRIRYLYYLINRNENEMLFKFLNAQWNMPVKNDWTIQVRQDLKDLNISEDFSVLKKYKKNAFKKMVKEKLKKYTFDYLLELKRSHSKMKNILYEKFEIQPYLNNSQLSVENMRDLFAFRTRMAEFGENFRGQRQFVICPFLCNQKDSQMHSFNCIGITQKLQIDSTYTEIFKNNIPVKTAYSLTKIRKLRESYLEEKSLSVFPTVQKYQKRKLH